MNTINDNPSHQQARNFSAQLGELAARASRAPQQGIEQPGIAPPILPARLAAVLAHFLERNQARENAAEWPRPPAHLPQDGPTTDMGG